MSRAATETTAIVSLGSWAIARSKVMFAIAAAALVLNLVDALFTLAYVTSGAATEANPIMAFFLHAGPVWFMVAKLALVSLGIELLWRFRNRGLAQFGLVAVLMIYSGIAIYHISALGHIMPSVSLALGG